MGMSAESEAKCRRIPHICRRPTLVVKVVHRITLVPQPVIAETLRAGGFILPVRVPKPPEGVAACLVIASVRVDVSEFLQRRMEIGTGQHRAGACPASSLGTLPIPK